MLQKKPKILCDLSVLAIHSSIPCREPSCWSNSPVVLCREQGSMRTTEFMPQTITNDRRLWLTTPCVPKWTLHWRGRCHTRSLTTCCRRRQLLLGNPQPLRRDGNPVDPCVAARTQQIGQGAPRVATGLAFTRNSAEPPERFAGAGIVGADIAVRTIAATTGHA